MARFYVLEVPENEGVIRVAADDPTCTVDRVGPYCRLTANGPIVIDRRATGVRHAVWYSAVSGLEASVVTQHDKDALRVESR
ncbi:MULTISPECIES: hypothetical protein [unclassified Nocardioides]|uniref:hypothetical protein n=1 Tax=unclassified Nocardioides TaxID=2615069 RepID=UPI0006F99BE4|nr:MULTISPECIES: hypothetical protein [unclassified Nocardioides]KQY55496.1 hypothetical protein ASD30_16480 [Nocardioides sp. Root140]KRF12767.1 hypothetical protein ASH02_14645 [Nocardioides sp. Soil796]